MIKQEGHEYLYDEVEEYFRDEIDDCSEKSASVHKIDGHVPFRERAQMIMHSQKFHDVLEEIPSDSDVSLCGDSDFDEEWEPQPEIPRDVIIPETSSSSEEDEEEDETPALDPQPSTSSQRKTTKPRPIYKWTKTDNSYGGVVPQFLGEHKVNVQVDTPVDFFLSLFTPELLEHIVYETNLYATQNGKENLCLTVPELKKFLGINLVMSYIRYPRVRSYWSSDPGLRMDLIANAMPVNRFELIMRFLHFTDNTARPPNDTDRLYKIRPVLDSLQESYLKAADPEEHQAVDEQIIPLKGKVSLKQYIPMKPKSWGVKVWVRAGSRGYVYRFEVYQGSSGNRDTISDFGACADVVLRLCDDIQNKNHKVFFDNLFTTVALLQELKKRGIHGTGTCRINRMQGAQLLLPSLNELKREGRGSSASVTNESNITITRWYDNSLVHIASTCAGNEPKDLAKRWSKKENMTITIARPFGVGYYNTHMGGVDLVDQCVALYPHRRRNKRWYLRVFFHFVDVTVVNCWFLSRESGNTLPLLDFKASVARALISLGSHEQNGAKRGRPSLTPPNLKRRPVIRSTPEVRYHEGNHWPKLTDVKNANRCHDVRCKRKTKYICVKCNEPLCPDCFANFHTK